MKLTVTYEDGTSVEATPGPADVLVFEDEHRTTLRDAIGSGSPRWSCFLAWHWLQRRRGEARAFELWLDTVSSIKSAKDPDGTGPEEGAADPTSAATATSASPTS